MDQKILVKLFDKVGVAMDWVECAFTGEDVKAYNMANMWRLMMVRGKSVFFFSVVLQKGAEFPCPSFEEWEKWERNDKRGKALGVRVVSVHLDCLGPILGLCRLVGLAPENMEVAKQEAWLVKPLCMGKPIPKKASPVPQVLKLKRDDSMDFCNLIFGFIKGRSIF